jgi:hypothetical protein
MHDGRRGDVKAEASLIVVVATCVAGCGHTTNAGPTAMEAGGSDSASDTGGVFGDDGGVDAWTDGSMEAAQAGPAMVDACAGGSPTDGGGCPGGSVTFEMYPGTGMYFAGTTQDTTSSNYNWLTVECFGGMQVVLQPANSTGLVDCRTCQRGWTVPIGVSWEQVGGDGGASKVVQTWNGAYLAQGTCAGATACLEPRCMGAGQYVAKLCGCTAIDTTTGNCQTQAVCTNVAFNYPATGPVIGGLP